MKSTAILMAVLVLTACNAGEQQEFYEGSNPFLDISGGKEDTGYVNVRGVELHVTLEADVQVPSSWRIFDAPPELAQFAVTNLRNKYDFYLEILAEDVTAQERVEWLVDGEWLTKSQAAQVDKSKLSRFRMRGVNAVLLDTAARRVEAGKVYETMVPLKPYTIMADAGDKCSSYNSHIDLSQSIYWYLWNPTKSGCPTELLQPMTVTVDEVLESNPSSYPEYDQLWEDGRLDVVVVFGKLDDKEDIEDDYNWANADRFSKWLEEAGFVEVDTAPLGRRFEKKIGELTEVVDVYYPDLFHSVADYARFHNWQKAVTEHEVVLYNGHSVLGSGMAFERVEYPDRYQIFQVASCLSYEYYVRPIMTGKAGWDSVDILSNVEPTYYHENLPLCGAFLAKLFNGFENQGRASWQDIMEAINRKLHHGRFGVSGARGNCFSPEGDRCNPDPDPDPDPQDDVLRLEAFPRLAIPDDESFGVSTSLSVTDDLQVGQLSVELDITHSYVGDLQIVLVHDDIEVMLWNRVGGGDKDIFRVFELSDYDGREAKGEWTLIVSDHAGMDTGMLKRWALVITRAGGDDPNNPSKHFVSADDAPLPDNDKTGIESIIEVPAGMTIQALEVELNIAHTYIGDLEIIIEHDGKQAVLWNRDGGSSDDIHQSFKPEAFIGQDAGGTWLLRVIDHARYDEGVLTGWSLTINPGA